MEKKATSRKELLELENKDTSSSPAASILRICGEEGKKSGPRVPKRDGNNLVTAPAPKSEVLGRVRDFLGVLSEANKTLELNAKDKPEEYNIEVLTGDESKYIEMDLMLGIADLHTPEAVAAAEAATAGRTEVLDLPSDSSSDESSSGSENDDDNYDDGDDNSEEEDSEEEVHNDNDDQPKQIGCPGGTLNPESQDADSLKVGVRSHKQKERQVGPLDEELQPRHMKKRPKIVELS